MLLQVPERNEIQSRKASLSKQLREFEDFSDGSTQRPDFTTLESNQCGNYIMFCCDNRELNSRSALFVLETNPSGMCACTYFIGQRSAL